MMQAAMPQIMTAATKKTRRLVPTMRRAVLPRRNHCKTGGLPFVRPPATRLSKLIGLEVLRPFLIPQLFLGGRDDLVRLEAELFLELLERRRRAEGLHADDAARLTDVALPSQGGGLFYGDASFHFGRQHPAAVSARLVIDDVPTRHRDHARTDAIGHKRLVGLH